MTTLEDRGTDESEAAAPAAPAEGNATAPAEGNATVSAEGNAAAPAANSTAPATPQ